MSLARYPNTHILKLALLKEQQHLVSLSEKLQACRTDFQELEQKRNKLIVKADEIKNNTDKGIINAESASAVIRAFRAAKEFSAINCHFAESFSAIDLQFEECARRHQAMVEQLNNAMQKRSLLVAHTRFAKEIALHKQELITNSI